MNVKINFVNIDSDNKLKTFVNQKVNKLSQFYEDILNADVFLKVENNQDLENKISEIKLDIPGSPLFAKKQGKTFEEATDTAVEALRRQLTKHKEKIRRV